MGEQRELFSFTSLHRVKVRVRCMHICEMRKNVACEQKKNKNKERRAKISFCSLNEVFSFFFLLYTKTIKFILENNVFIKKFVLFVIVVWWIFFIHFSWSLCSWLYQRFRLRQYFFVSIVCEFNIRKYFWYLKTFTWRNKIQPKWMMSIFKWQKNSFCN